MAQFLVHVTTGPDDPTKAALAFFVARTVLEEGHQLVLFVAGDGVHLLCAPACDSLEGLGTGRLAEHFAAINAGSARVYFSGLSAKARGITPDAIALKGAEAGAPAVLVRLAAESDVVLCY